MKLKINWGKLIGNEKNEVSFTKLGELVQSVGITFIGLPAVAATFEVSFTLPDEMVVLGVIVIAIGRWLIGVGKRDANLK